MAKKRYTLRFYSYHDMDLIKYVLADDFSITRTAYEVINAFVRGESYTTGNTENKIEIPEELRHLKRVYKRCLVLDSVRDADAVRFMSRLKPGARNCVVKNLLRFYFNCPVDESFWNEKPEALEAPAIEDSTIEDSTANLEEDLLDIFNGMK